jgi:hypothetical protein
MLDNAVHLNGLCSARIIWSLYDWLTWFTSICFYSAAQCMYWFSSCCKMEPKNVPVILQIRSICAENEWIYLPILEKHIVGASLQFFLKDVLSIVKATEKSITKVLCIHWKFCALQKKTSILNCTLTMLRTHQLKSSWRMTSFSPPRKLKVMCILCGFRCHLVAAIHVILQATLEFYKVFFLKEMQEHFYVI